MNLTSTIITVAGAGIVSAFAEGMCEKMNKQDYAQFIRVSGFAVASSTVLTSIAKFLNELKKI